MENSALDSFDLYREAMRQYELIVPEQVDGLVILALYEQFGNESFKEEQINAVIDKVHWDLGKSTQRTEYDRNNTIILKLQEFYLSRDEHKKNYQFKTFGKQFCHNIRERLLSTYNPARIKRLFDGLHLDLGRYLGEEELTFDMWFSEHFVRVCPEITAHVEILDQQVSQSVREFRKGIKAENVDMGSLLDDIISRLDGIKGQAKELKEAFASTYDIDYILEDILIHGAQYATTANIQSVFDFNGSIRGQLEQISMRIDHIKPRIREFIYEFNQRDFDRKTGIFLDFLIRRSQQVKNASGKRRLELPAKIPGFVTSDQAVLPRFVVIPDKDITPKQPVEITKRRVDLDRQKIALEEAKIKRHIQARVSYWVAQLKERLLAETEIDFSQVFYEIMALEGDSMGIPIKVASKIIREFPKQKFYGIEIEQEITRNLSYPNIRLWKMQIKKL